MKEGRWYRDPSDRLTWYEDDEIRVAITDQQVVLDMDILCKCRDGHISYVSAAYLSHQGRFRGGSMPPTCGRRLYMGIGGVVTCQCTLRPMTAGEHAAFLLGGEAAFAPDPK